MAVLAKPEIIVSVTADNGGGYSTKGLSIADALATGINHARFLMRDDNPERTHCKVRVEILCSTCGGSGQIPGSLRRGSKRCPDCAGGKITSPVSGPTAIVITVARHGAIFSDDGGATCQCGVTEREGAPGAVCQRCAKGVAR